MSTHTTPKIVFIGAGSTVFAKNLIGDILSFPELARSTIMLHDIDAERLALSQAIAQHIAARLGVSPTIEATIDRRAALEGADYAINMIQVGGYQPATVIDFEIPRRHGLRQTIGDTLGIGGIMRGLRTIPVLLEMARDMEELCPDVLHLNYANPMAMNCWALNRSSTIRTVGLCHSVQGTAAELARDIDVPIEEINYLCAGINHLAFYLRFERQGEDLYPQIRRVIDAGRVPEHNRVRYEMLHRLGYFVTESSEHFSEYVPWFIKRDRPDLIERFNIPLDEYLGRCQVYERMWDFLQERDLLGGNAAQLDAARASALEDATLSELASAWQDIQVMPRSVAWTLNDLRHFYRVVRTEEYASYIIHSVETGIPRVIYGNVPNDGLIDNLPAGCCVEVPCLVDANGVQPTPVGALPPQLAALMRTNVNVQELTVEAALTGKREHIYHAALLDPHTAAELDLDQIWHMVDDLIEAHGDWLPAFR